MTLGRGNRMTLAIASMQSLSATLRAEIKAASDRETDPIGAFAARSVIDAMPIADGLKGTDTATYWHALSNVMASARGTFFRPTPDGTSINLLRAIGHYCDLCEHFALSPESEDRSGETLADMAEWIADIRADLSVC